MFSSATVNPANDVKPECGWSVEPYAITLTNLPNVYSGESLDLGARFILEHLPADPTLEDFIDLGCGNGVLSVRLGQLNPQAKITCVDESFMAIASAQKTYTTISVNEIFTVSPTTVWMVSQRTAVQ